MSMESPKAILGEQILEGKEWRDVFPINRWGIYENGMVVDKTYILWKRIEELYISAASSPVNFIPMGDQYSITAIGLSGKEIKLDKFSKPWDRGKTRERFSTVYGSILSFIMERQWEEFLKRISEGQRVSFGSFYITKEGIYCRKHMIFSKGFDKLEPTSICGSSLYGGDFYIHTIRDGGKVMDRRIGHVKAIPNIHIAQKYIDLLRYTHYTKKSS